MIGLVTRKGGTDAHEVDMLLLEFAAYLIHGTVGIGEKENMLMLLQECLLQDVEQPEGRLARTRRTDDEKHVLGPLGPEYEFVHGPIVSEEFTAFIGCRFLLEEQ